MKYKLANTELKIRQLMARLAGAEEVGADTEVVGPLLRNRKKPFVNVLHAQLLGVSIAFDDEVAYYMPLRHKGKNTDFAAADLVMAALASVPIVWFHNLKFDSKALEIAGYPVPAGARDSYLAAWLATASAEGIGLKELARGLGREAADYDPLLPSQSGAEALKYAADDAANTLAVGRSFASDLDTLGLLDHLAEVESPYALLLGRMERQGMRINAKGLQSVSQKCRQDLARIGTDWIRLFPEVSITSSSQLQELYEDGTWVTDKTTATGNYSTAHEDIEAQLTRCPKGSRGYKAARLRLDYQERNKIASTYTLKFIEEARQHPDGKLHPSYNQTGARTGRLSSANPNAQNLPKAGSFWGDQIRGCIIPDSHHTFTAADYSQIELRLLAHYAGGDLKVAYLEGRDIHAETAEAIGTSRDDGKTFNFGFLTYGGGPYKASRTFGWSVEEARRKIDTAAKKYQHIEAFRKRVVKRASGRKPPYVKTITGRRRYIPELLSADRWERAKGERLAVNTIIQGSAADLMKIAMLRIDDRARAEKVPGYAMIATVHDEVLTQSRDPAKLEVIIRECMIGVGEEFGISVPLEAAPKSGGTWADVK